MSTMRSAATTMADIGRPKRFPGPHSTQVPTQQVTGWLQSKRQDRVSKMDNFFTDVSHKRACILITCSRPDKLTLSVIQYFVPRRVICPL